ncbi:FERM domain-containing protein 4A [Araneus ventricosus]|uniref:FERM domain-containing protein 4A n=1 Tax=Araneus ventricosus TaxID=182803 RepID=A0A4Y2LUC9_ARAVE|nr:FERM domain-containing protein 4A [Araneus ventricosus]
MSEGRRSQVVLLDERRLDIVIQSRLYAGELLDIVASHFNLKEKEYFGLSFIDESSHHSWLQLDKRVLEHDFPKKYTSQGAVLILYFRIKYYVESITQLRDSATIEAFYLQTKSLIAKVSQVCTVKEFWFTLALRFDIRHDDTKFVYPQHPPTPYRILDSPL